MRRGKKIGKRKVEKDEAESSSTFGGDTCARLLWSSALTAPYSISQSVFKNISSLVNEARKALFLHGPSSNLFRDGFKNRGASELPSVKLRKRQTELRQRSCLPSQAAQGLRSNLEIHWQQRSPDRIYEHHPSLVKSITSCPRGPAIQSSQDTTPQCPSSSSPMCARTCKMPPKPASD